MKKTICSGLVLLVALLTVNVSGAQSKAKESLPVKNVIFLIGDGMGATQVTLAMLAKGSPLAIERAQYTGLTKTYSATDKVTDSAASGTALATGTKTYNGAIGVDVNKQPLTSILKRASAKGMATGLIATYSITDATPAVFIANNESRANHEEIAADFLNTPINYFVGGGRTPFEQRKDGRVLTNELKDKGYQICYTIDEVLQVKSGRVAGLLSPMNMPSMNAGRGDVLPRATAKALELLPQMGGEKGFFIMIEGSQIDGGGHANDSSKVVTETLDFDQAVALAMDYADRTPGTLVVVTADHETGGLTLPANDSHGYKTHFSTGGHTGMMVPVYAYGAGASAFTGVMENTDIPQKIATLLQLK